MADTPAPPNTDVDTELFDARYRWAIRQEMRLPLCEIIELSTDEVEGFYKMLRDQVIRTLIASKLDPRAVALPIVKVHARKHVATLRGAVLKQAASLDAPRSRG